MNTTFYTAFQNEPYPCFWYGQNHTFWWNNAVESIDNFNDILTAVKNHLQASIKNRKTAAGTKFVQLPTSGAPILQLMIIPHASGIFASLPQDDALLPAHNLSAQLREPITNIFATLPLLMRKSDEDAAPYAESVQANCYSLLRVANNLESSSRIQRRALHLQYVDFGTLIGSVVASTNSICRQNGVPITYSVPASPLLVKADAVLLQESMLNLIRNSLQYTRDSNQIHIKLYKTGGRAVLCVEDRGMGIKPEYLESIFTPNFSIDPYGDTVLKPGLGLGLTIAAQTAYALKGTIAAESTFGEGTKITLALPLAMPPEDEPPLRSDPADFLMNRYSPVYIQLSGLCRLPAL